MPSQFVRYGLLLSFAVKGLFPSQATPGQTTGIGVADQVEFPSDQKQPPAASAIGRFRARGPGLYRVAHDPAIRAGLPRI